MNNIETRGNIWYRLLFVWLIVLFVAYSALSILRHNHFQSGAFDLGIYDQVIWQHSRFISPYSTVKERFILGDHMTITLPLISPLFYIWNDVRILLLFQAFLVIFSTLGIYKLALSRKCSPLTAFSISVVYSLFYGFQSTISFDFHPIMIAAGFFSWMIYFFETKRWMLFYICLLLVVLSIENMGFAVAALGIYYLFSQKDRKPGLVFFVGGITIGLLFSYMVSVFSPIGYEYTPDFPNTISEIITRFYDHPDKRQVLLYSFSWFSFLPLLSPGATLAVLFDLAQYFITGDAVARMWSPYTHHRVMLGIFLTLGTLDAFLYMKKRNFPVEKLAIALAVVTFMMQYIFHFPLNRISKHSYWRDEPWMNDTREIIAAVPKDASVAAQHNLVPHLSHRKEIYLVWPREYPEGWRLHFAGKPEYLVVDTRSDQWLTQLLETNENFQEALANMEKNGSIVLEKEVGYSRLYRVQHE